MSACMGGKHRPLGGQPMGFAAIGGSHSRRQRLAARATLELWCGTRRGPPARRIPPRSRAGPPMTDSKQQRINMVESQVRPSDVTDRRIIRAMLEVPREAFVPQSLQALAYMDEAVPAAESAGGRPGRCLLAPRTLAKLMQLAEVGPGAVVLDVGCATGYSTAVLARLAKAVVAVEVDAALAARATQTLRRLGVGNAAVIEGALEKGAASHAP